MLLQLAFPSGHTHPAGAGSPPAVAAGFLHLRYAEGPGSSKVFQPQPPGSPHKSQCPLGRVQSSHRQAEPNILAKVSVGATGAAQVLNGEQQL